MKIRITKATYDKLAESTRWNAENELMEIVASGKISAIDLRDPKTFESNVFSAIENHCGKERAEWATQQQIEKVAKFALQKMLFALRWFNSADPNRQSERMAKVREAHRVNCRRLWAYERDHMFVDNPEFPDGDPRAYGSYPRN